VCEPIPEARCYHRLCLLRVRLNALPGTPGVVVPVVFSAFAVVLARARGGGRCAWHPVQSALLLRGPTPFA